MRRSHHSLKYPRHRHRLHRLTDLAELIEQAWVTRQSAETIVIPLDATHHFDTVLCVESASSSLEVADVGAFALEWALRSPGVHGLLLATSRPGPPACPLPGDEELWFDLRCSWDDEGIALVDWCLVGGGRLVSMSHCTGSTCRWWGRDGLGRR